ncbi:FtsX-like permease family protein [Kibdelosporangium persicum]|uniref:ABC transporter permease n=1 Tax=Kibdelosporangium persicum TaxID=2698649 RepID=A0ABX2F8G5_9PSEU|nr:FtsX-like permease family protein [Kibdelosporangium persicum]NRN67265.1 ABC transporter permease [Kibdelosporangium persicum]
MLRLALQTARRRVAALVAVACAMFGGAALVTGIGVIAESGLRSQMPVERLARADVVVSAPQSHQPPEDLPIGLPERNRLPVELTERLAGVPDVTAVIGDVSFPAAVLSAQGTPVTASGHGWSATRLADEPGVTGQPPTRPDELAVDAGTAAAAGVQAGDRVNAVVAGRTAQFRVTAVVTSPEPGLYFADDTAIQFTERRVDFIAIQAAPGRTDNVATAVREALGDNDLVVSTGADRGDVESPGAAAARSFLPALAGSMAGVTLLIIGFIVAGALSVSIAGQRRDLALLRAVGASPKQIRGLAAGQATLMAAPALVLGAGAGYLLADLFRGMLVGLGFLPAGLPLTVSPFPAVAALLLLLLVVQAAARGSAWRTSRLPATEAVSESRVEPRTPSKTRTYAGVLLIVAANVIAVIPLVSQTSLGANTTAIAGILATVGLGLCGPAMVRWVSSVLAAKLPARVSAPTWLAVANTNGYAMRVAGAVTTLAMAVVFTLTYTLTQTTLITAIDRDVEATGKAELHVTAPATGGLPQDALDAITTTPGVKAAAPVSTTTVLWPGSVFGQIQVESSSALILTPAAANVLDLDVRSGDLNDLTGATVAVSGDADLGSEVGFHLGDGTFVKAKVVATYGRGLGIGEVVVSRDLAIGHTTSGLDQRILIRTDDPGTVRASLASNPVLVVGEGSGLATGTGIPPELWINIVVLGVLLGYLLLGIANKLVASTAQRRAELANLRLIGATARQLRRMMRREASVICGIALVTGLVLAAVPIVLLSLGLLGQPWPAGPVWLLPLVMGVVVVIAFAAIELPTWQALRPPPVDARNHQS